ncbi:serpin peptidase inhibitor, clade F (alpha-2 antiplasmin, pigment epithelium derived factor), member 2b [Osmerus eperlanus]|uniref:serpin peptidase inhibitor, clade F (alpha-2 antiplasmin, pigment epithelium derived factor), member 2b n=1 Tax=Osmerus eperlanus TaxID=29151 RepID=UPI002E11A49E
MKIHLLALMWICLCGEGLTQSEIPDPNPPLPPTAGPTLEPHFPDAANTDVPNRASSDEETEEGCESLGHSPQSKEALAKAILRLGMRVLENLKTTPEQPNVIVSPLSISLALSQLALGSVNETEELLMRHLHDNTLACYHQSLHNLLAQLKDSDLQLATRIFLKPGFQPRSEFIQESLRMYDSEPVPLEGLKEVNEWVKKATNGFMSEFLSSLPPNLVLMLINAVHFKGEWRNRFDSRFTSRGAFHIDENHIVDVDMMEGAKHPLSLLSDYDLEAQVARFPFRKMMSLLVVMPTSGHVNISTLAAKLNISDLYDRLPKERAMQVKLPKFKLQYTQELQETLTSMGLGELFVGPNLAGISEGPLLVSSVHHRTSMEINEEGAEAAAASSVGVSRSNPSFNLNQPFFFALMDDMTQAPIFLGVITNPNPEAPVLQKGGSGNKDKFEYPIDKNLGGLSFGGPPK